MALLALLCGAISAPVQAKTAAHLKLQVSLDAGFIKVSDIWGDAGAKAETIIGPAPPPGRSIAIEAGQLAYIAHLYDVDWKPVSGVERTTVERAGRPLTHDEIEEPIRRSLVDAGAPASVAIELANLTPILVPPLSFPTVAVEASNYDLASERFSADVVISTDGMQTQRTRVAGRIVKMVTAVVATRRLDPGDVITASDLRTMPVADRRGTGSVAKDISEVVGQTPKRSIMTGQPVATADLGAPIMVPKGATVVLLLETPNMSLAAQGLALGAGGRDDVIQVMNPVSKAVVAARVTGTGRAVVLPGSSPIVPPARATQRSPEIIN